MQDDRAALMLFKTLNEARAARRKAQVRLDQITQETGRLRAEIIESDSTIQRVQHALRNLIGESRPEIGFDQLDFAAPPSLEEPPRYEPRPRPPAGAARVALEQIEVKTSRFAELKIPQAATIILREVGGPLHVNELYRRMVEEGFHFGGDNHLISLAVSLNRNPRFRKVGPSTFDLVIRDAGQVA